MRDYFLFLLWLSLGLFVACSTRPTLNACIAEQLKHFEDVCAEVTSGDEHDFEVMKCGLENLKICMEGSYGEDL